MTTTMSGDSLRYLRDIKKLLALQLFLSGVDVERIALAAQVKLRTVLRWVGHR